MATTQDYYEILGVPRNADDEEIKKAFRRLAFQYHPDHNREPGAVDQFKRVNEAYQVLCDPERRAAYDRYGRVTSESRGFDGFEFGGFGDIFDAFFSGSAPPRRTEAQRGSDLQVRVALSFEEAIFGCDKEIEVQRTENCAVCKGSGCQPGTHRESCPTCGGAGQVRRQQQSIFGRFVQVVTCNRCGGQGTVVKQPCAACRGTGRDKTRRKLVVPIPIGVDDGYQLELDGQGNAGSGGAPAGRLFVTINVKPHRFFRRDGVHIYYEMPINFARAALGGEAEVPTLEGKMRIKIPAGVQSGKILRIKGKGVHLPGERSRGDQLVVVRVVSPRSLDDRQKKLFEELSKTLDTPETPGEDGDDGVLGKVKDIFGERT